MHPSVPQKVIYLGKIYDVMAYLPKTNQYRIMLEEGDGEEIVVHRANIHWEVTDR